MKKFDFSLQRVLDIRETEEDLKKQFFGQCRREYLDSQEVLSGMMEMKDDCINRALVLPGQRILIEEQEHYNHYLGVLSDKIERQKEDVTELLDKMDEAREDWVNKRKEKMILERLKEKRQRAHVKEVLLREQYMIDEIASLYGGMEEL